jgi:hypothetical protein
MQAGWMGNGRAKRWASLSVFASESTIVVADAIALDTAGGEE